MEQREINAKAPKAGTEATVVVNFPTTVEEAVQAYGEEALLSNAFANWRVTLQANIRNSLTAGATQEQIQDKLKDAKMGVAVTGGRVDAETAFLAKFKIATPEEQAEMLNKLRAAAQIG